MHPLLTRPRFALAFALLIPAWTGLHAQPLGTFRWQLQPFCNVVTVSVIQNGAIYTMDGYDDQCGGTSRAPVVGLATPNPDGSIGMGFHLVTTPSATPVSVQATISLATLGGTWRDSAGNTGTFAFGAATGGNPRPPAVAAFPAGIAAGGARVTNVGTPTQPTDAATKGYVDAADATLAAADTAIAAQLPPANQFTFLADGGFVARGAGGGGTIPASGEGVRMMWYPSKAAFRAGYAGSSGAWDDANVGPASTAMGDRTVASGQSSTAMGGQTAATGLESTAMGFRTEASGAFSTATGRFSEATGVDSTAMGFETAATGSQSTAMGSGTAATGSASTAMGQDTTAAGAQSIAMGTRSIANGANSVVLGTDAGAAVTATGSFVYGDASDTTAVNLVASVPNSFLVRAAGGTTFFSNAARTAGVRLNPGAGAWTNLSDAARKQTFRDLDGETVLSKLRAMPIREWSYISQGDGIRHAGPTAQDFRAAFGLGEDPLGISTIDADGISLRAIQALEARTQSLQSENERLRAELAEIRHLIAATIQPR